MNALLKFFLYRWRVTYLLIIASVIFGLLAMFSLPREAEPEVQVPYASVMVMYPGASPSDMEELITRKIEDKIEAVDNVKKTTSSSRAGVASVFVEFEAQADIDKSIEDLKDKIDEARGELPENAEDPVVSEISFSDFPIVTFSLSGEGLSEEHLSDVGNDIKDNLEKIGGVSRVALLGEHNKEIEILLDREKLAGIKLSAGAVIGKIRAGHLDFPLGEVLLDDKNIALRLTNKFFGAEDLKKLPLLSTERGAVLLEDVALVRETRQKETSISLLSSKGGEPLRTISLQIYKKTGGNIIQIADGAKAKIEEMRVNKQVPAELKVEVSNDNSQFIRDDLDKLSGNGIQTIIIVFVLIWLALSWREALIAGLSVPLAFLLTFATIAAEDKTLNSMSLFALVLSLGLLVDTTIVITEGIFDNLRIKKMKSDEAALDAVKTFWAPVMSGTMTTVAAFAPLLLVSGIMGEYLGVLPLTIAPVLIWSLVIALFFVPAVAARLFKTLEIKDFKEMKITVFFRRQLKTLLTSLLHNKSKRRSLYATLLLIFGGALALPITGALPVEMFPAYDADYFNITLEMPPGTALEKTYAEAQPIKEILQKNPRVDNFLFAVGVGALGRTGHANDSNAGGSTSANQASFTVNLVPAEDRETTSFEIAEQIRTEIAKIKTAGVITIEELKAGPPSGKPIEVRIFGDDLPVMELLAKEIKKEVEKVPGIIDPVDSVSLSAGEFVFRLDREKIDFYGLSPATVATELRTTVFGAKATEIARGKDDINIRVAFDWQNDEQKPQSIREIESIPIFTPGGKMITVGDVANVALEQGFSVIEHQDGRKIVRVQAAVKAGEIVAEKTAELEEKVRANVQIPDSIEVEFGGSTEDIDESFAEVFRSMIVAVILIAFILILQFQSFSQPFIILLTLPMALIGVLWGFFLVGWPISFPTFIGIVSLTGIVVNDAIVLIDRVNETRRVGMELKTALIEAAVSRTKPIFLTSITTICGILPLALSDKIWGGLGFAIIFGLTFSTFLTLVVVPNLYYTFEKNRRREEFNHIPENERSPFRGLQ